MVDEAMARRWEILFHGYGFLVEMEDGDTLTGFYTARRIRANSQREAEIEALRALWKEEKIQALLEETREATGNSTSFQIVADETALISWYQWTFGSYAKGLIFYGPPEEGRSDFYELIHPFDDC